MTGSTNCTTSPIELQSIALRVIGSEHHGRVLRIQAPKCTIGSAAGCTLRLKAPGVHDVHCLVLRGPGGLVVRSWSHDTRLNGQAVTDAPLQVGDHLAIGPIELEVLDPAQLDQLTDRNPAGAFDNGRLSKLEHKAREAARARDELARRLAERDQSVAQLEERLATTQQLVDQLQTESQAHASPETAPDAATLAEIESLKQQAETLAQQFEVARHSFATERETWQRERQNFQLQFEEAQNQIQLLTHGIDQARAEVIQKQATWDHQHAHLIADLERARHQIATHVEQQREAREVEVAITHWRERAEELAEQCKALQQQIEELQYARDDASSEHMKLRAELEAGARELDAETERLFEREEALVAQTQQFEAEYERASNELEVREQQLQALRSDLEARQAALEAHMPGENASAETLQAQAAEIAALQQQLAELQANYEQQTSQLEQRRAELDARAQQLETLQMDLEARQAALESQPPVEPSSDETLQAQAAEIAALQQQLADLQANYEQQTSELEQRRAELDARASDLDRQAEELRLEAERLAAEAQELQRQREASSELPTYDDQPSEPESEAAETKEYVAQSAAEIIARLNASGLWKDDDVAIEEPAAEQAAPEPVWKSLVTEEPKPAPVAAHEEEDSIEAYMQRLLQRVSGESEARPRETQPQASLPIVTVTETAAPTTEVAEEPAHEPFDPSKYVPRSMAPEASSKLAAMRELANSSARSAIHTSTKRRAAKHLTGKVAMAIFAVAAAISLGWLALQTRSALSYYAAIAACIAGLLWGLHAGYLWLRKSRHVIDERSVEDDELRPEAVAVTKAESATEAKSIAEAERIVESETVAQANDQLVEAEAPSVDNTAEQSADENSQAI